MAERFSHGADIPAKILEQIKARRREVQGPIVAVYQESTADAWEAKIEKPGPGSRIPPPRRGKAAVRTAGASVPRPGRQEVLQGRRVRPHHRRIVARPAYPHEEAAVHDGDRGRGLRFGLPQEALSPGDALPRSAGNRQRPRHGENAVRGLAVKIRGVDQKAFLEGLLLAEERATEDLRAAFLATWTPQAVSSLKRQFRAYGG